MSKLTAADAAKYWGCQVVDPETSIKGYISAINDGGVYIDYGMGVTFIQFNNYIKLALRPLSKITDEDAIEVAKIAGIGKYEAKEFIGCQKDDYKTIGRYIVAEFQYPTYIELRIHTDKYIAIIDFLRSRSYDCDNFISQGKAIEI